MIKYLLIGLFISGAAQAQIATISMTFDGKLLNTCHNVLHCPITLRKSITKPGPHSVRAVALGTNGTRQVQTLSVTGK